MSSTTPTARIGDVGYAGGGRRDAPEGKGREFLGRGWRFPLALEPGSGRIALSEYEQDIREAIRIILGTAKGERVMRPDFGCGIHTMVFTPLNATTLALVESTVRDALLEYEPRIDVTNILVSRERIADGVLQVGIDYVVRTTNRPDNVVFPFYLTGAG